MNVYFSLFSWREKNFETLRLIKKTMKSVNQRFNPTQFTILHQFLGKLQPSSVLFLKKVRKEKFPVVR